MNFRRLVVVKRSDDRPPATLPTGKTETRCVAIHLARAAAQSNWILPDSAGDVFFDPRSRVGLGGRV